jgi:hypothetical protein
MRARAVLIGSLAVVVWSLCGAAQSRQPIPASVLEDQVLGWIKVYNYQPATAPITVDARVYSPAQLTIARQFANWMQASYLPKGALGDVLQIRNAKLGLYNQKTAAHPAATALASSTRTEVRREQEDCALTSGARQGIQAGFTGSWTISTPSAPIHAADVRAAGIRD